MKKYRGTISRTGRAQMAREQEAMKDPLDAVKGNAGAPKSFGKGYWDKLGSKRNNIADVLKYTNKRKKSKKKCEPGDMYKAYQKKKKLNLSGLKNTIGMVSKLPGAIGKAITGGDMKDKFPKQNYHDKAQTFIKGARAKGMTVKAENSELIAYPKGFSKGYGGRPHNVFKPKTKAKK